jgi:TfoX/Sxy family transcriptional regulator of competence genes
MPSSRSVADHIIDQARGAGAVSARAMFGEYGICMGDLTVALICDDRLFVKPTEAGRQFAGPLEEASPYPGAKPYLVIPEDRWEDADWMATLFATTARNLPAPKPKKPRKVKAKAKAKPARKAAPSKKARPSRSPKSARPAKTTRRRKR